MNWNKKVSGQNSYSTPSWQYWVGTGLTLVAVCVNIWQTNVKIEHVSAQGRMELISDVVSKVMESTWRGLDAIGTYESIYYQLENCLAIAENTVTSCSRRNYGVDHDKTTRNLTRWMTQLKWAEKALEPYDAARANDMLDSVRKLDRLQGRTSNVISQASPIRTPQQAETAMNQLAELRDQIEVVLREL